MANIINENDEKYLYHSKNILKKLKIGIKSFIRRWKHLKDIESFDLVVIYRESEFQQNLLFLRIIFQKKIYQWSLILTMQFG